MKEGRWRMPAEWEKQEGVLLCFPHNGKDWPGKFGAIQWAFVEFIKKISRYEQVFLVVKDASWEEKVKEKLSNAHIDLTKIIFIIEKTNRSWMRDSGPIIIRNESERKALDFNFSGWAKYSNYRLDRNVPNAVAKELGIPLEKVIYDGKPFTLEGGAIDVNGQGILITTEECLLHPGVQVRNHGLGKKEYESVFRDYLGVDQVIWLKDGITGDDTHGHVDDLARFVNPETIITVVEIKRKDSNYVPLQENLKILRNIEFADGYKPEIVELPMPQRIDFEGIRLPASYANFLIINGAVLVPVFNDVHDRIALNILASCFPERDVIGIGAIDLIWGFGTLHCLSQQIPL